MTAALLGCLPRSEGEPGCPVCPKGPVEAEIRYVDTIDQGTRSGIRDERKLVIRDWDAWRALWAEHTKGQVPSPSLPYVDFARAMVIGVFLGEKPTSGHAVEIVEVRVLFEKLLVRVQVTTPPPGAILLQVLTQPFHLVKVPRYEGPVVFELFPSADRKRP